MTLYDTLYAQQVAGRVTMKLIIIKVLEKY